MDPKLAALIGTLAVAGALSATLFYVSLTKRPSRGAIPLAALSLSVLIWQFGYAFELLSDELLWGIRWAKFQYFGIVTIPLAWFVLTASYTGHTRWSRPKVVFWLSLVPLTTLALALTNETHGLIWADVVALDNGMFSFVHGPWFWVFSLYSYLLVILGVVLLSPVMTVSPAFYMQQAGALFISVLIPWGANSLYTVGITPLPDVNPTPYVFGFSAVIVGWAIRYRGLLSRAPVPRSKSFEGFADGVIILDSVSRVVDLNMAAKAMLGGSERELVNHTIQEVWPQGSSIIDQLDSPGGRVQAELEFQGKTQMYEIVISSLANQEGESEGRMILLHPVNDAYTDRALKETDSLVMTSTELDVFELAIQGLPNPEIATQLDLSESAVKTHLEEAVRKLRLVNRSIRG